MVNSAINSIDLTSLANRYYDRHNLIHLSKNSYRSRITSGSGLNTGLNKNLNIGLNNENINIGLNGQNTNPSRKTSDYALNLGAKMKISSNFYRARPNNFNTALISHNLNIGLNSNNRLNFVSNYSTISIDINSSANIEEENTEDKNILTKEEINENYDKIYQRYLDYKKELTEEENRVNEKELTEEEKTENEKKLTEENEKELTEDEIEDEIEEEENHFEF